MTRVLAWWVRQVRFWDTASGEAVRQIYSREFAFNEVGAGRTHNHRFIGAKQRINRHFLEVIDDTLRITALRLDGGVEDGAHGVLQGAAEDPIHALPWHNDLRGMLRWRGLHFAGAVPRNLRRELMRPPGPALPGQGPLGHRFFELPT
jgi:hypothetical protein